MSDTSTQDRDTVDSSGAPYWEPSRSIHASTFPGCPREIWMPLKTRWDGSADLERWAK